MSNHHFP